MTLYLLKAKNYYDRKAFRYSTISEYQLNGATIIDIINDYDFNPNDGIWTNILVNTASSDFDYVIAVDNTIQSRWYAIDATRKRAEQYHVKLLRDVIADYYDDIINAPTFIEKATVKYGNPLLFNKEDMGFNQIKSKETLLMDATTSAWIVGYVAKNTEATNIDIQSTVKPVPTYSSWSDVPFGSYRGENLKGNVSQLYFSVFYRALGGSGDGGDYIDRVQFNKFGNTTWKEFPEDGQAADYQAFQTYGNMNATKIGREQNGRLLANRLSSYYDDHQTEFNNALDFLSDSQTAEFLNTYSTTPTTIKVGDSYYNVSRREVSTVTDKVVGIRNGSGLAELLADACEDSGFTVYRSQISETNLRYAASYSIWSLVAEGVSAPVDTAYHTSIPAPTQRTSLTDGLYDMFCIPYSISNPRFVTKASGSDYSVNPEVSMSTAQAIATQLGSQIYDLQLLPYCPIDAIMPTSYGSINIDLLTEGKDYNWVYKGTGDTNHNNTSIILWASSSQFSRTISKYYDLPASGVSTAYSIAIKVEEPKIQALGDSYRIASPNYNGQFEFNAVMNEGVEFFTVDCTYKPYSPYIRVAPNFKGLYGGDYDDARGLICGGDFSLPIITDQWKQYEINNKNYLNAFNRQIENLEINQKYQRMSEVVGATVGAVSTGVTSGMTGALMGGGTGAAIGAIGGTALSGAAGIIDVGINDKLRTEALDYTKDQFGYQLGNIRALPYSLNRVSAFNINNKIFPILEYYTCTETEKQALRDKIQYNGMTVQTIGTVAQYIQEEPTYIKGRIIRFEDLGEDYHLAVAIAEELYKGVFI